MPRSQQTVGTSVLVLSAFLLSIASSTAAQGDAAARQVYFGDLHVHTSLSIDAFITNTRTLPDDAYRYAKGEAIEHLSGRRIRIGTPLDFMAVTDHAEMLGVARAMEDPGHPLADSPLAAAITSSDYAASHEAFRQIVASAAAGSAANDLIDPGLAQTAIQSAWLSVIEAAERHNRPGTFTTFVGYEWSSMPELANLHRNVIYRGTTVPPIPFSSGVSNRPEDLWAHLDGWRERGEDVIAIPHNSNASKGRMYPLVDSDGEPVDAEYSSQRLRNEPITELTQFKGTSETHPVLSPLDEYANFEIWNTVVGAPIEIEPDVGSYVRSAWIRGLQVEAESGFNPFKFGVIGASDSHNSSSAVEEDNFTGGHGNADMTPEIRLNSKASTLTASSLNFSASGLGGVWAEENTRESIFDALRRRETFATSGPRIRVRFFAGARLPLDLWNRDDAVEAAYEQGVTMGSDLVVEAGEQPRFAIWALRDPRGAPLERVQIVKGWIEDGEPREQIFDVACADRQRINPETHRCVGEPAPVNLETCAFSSRRGAAELRTVWSDPSYRPGVSAVYYVRVLENPTCRWSTWDAVRTDARTPRSKAKTIQERAWSSPIWVASR